MNTFYHGDCLFVLTHDIPKESVDLIYLDPPFFTGKIQKGKDKWHPEAMEISFEDRKQYWASHLDKMRQKAPLWLSDVGDKHPEFAAYLYYMMERLWACYGVLHKKGSIYLHCDYRASHYLKHVMDDIFGRDNFRNEIIWQKLSTPKAQTRGFGNIHDSILWYSKSKQFTFHETRIQHKKQYLQTMYRFTEPHTQRVYRLHDFTQKGQGEPRTFGDRGVLAPPEGKHWIWSQEKIDDGLERGLIVFSKTGKPQVKRYLDEVKGHRIGDIWTDVNPIGSVAKERLGYPTQKPEALLERIIKSSSNEGDLVLDPFCGCGTAIIVAHKNNRRWVGIDINKEAWAVILEKANQPSFDQWLNSFKQASYVSRDLAEVKAMNPNEFEIWVNQYYGAQKPSPDKYVDGITKEGIPIQSRTTKGGVDLPEIHAFHSAIQYHPRLPSGVKQAIFVSQNGFSNRARQAVTIIQAKEGITIHLVTPEDMLKLD